jgi:sec-independent protein translocase protein TatC
VFERIILGPIQKDFITYTGLCQFSHWQHMGDSLCMPPSERTSAGQYIRNSIHDEHQHCLHWRLYRSSFLCFLGTLAFREAGIDREGIEEYQVQFFLCLLSSSWGGFGYFLLAPFTYSFWRIFLGNTGIMKTIPTLSDYIENLIDIIIGSALAFQLPIISYVLTRIGLILLS